ncbi:unnamed protein product, partial [Agarophyton chilense]
AGAVSRVVAVLRPPSAPVAAAAAASPDRVVDVAVFRTATAPSPVAPLLEAPVDDHNDDDYNDNGVAGAALRVLATLLLTSAPACAHALVCGALPVLADAAQPRCALSHRIRAAAALAAVAAWSGPRHAVVIVETPAVVPAMCAVLDDTHRRFPPDLRAATIDALVAMSHRGHARRILQRYGCDEKITLAARHASLSGDFTAAARTTVAAGHLSGRSIDEYGFFVNAEKRPSIPSADQQQQQQQQQQPQQQPKPLHSHSALSNLAHAIMHEPYTSVDNLDALQPIVSPHEPQPPHHGEAEHHVASHSPVVHSHPHSPLAVADAVAAQAQHSPLLPLSVAPSSSSSSRPPSLSASPLPQPLFDQSPGVSPAPHHQHQQQHASPPALEEQPSSGSPRPSANFADPDFDKLRTAEDLRAGHQQHSSSDYAGSPSSAHPNSALSPLLMFSSATEAAAKRSDGAHAIQKTNSQITRESEHERIWKELMDHRPEMLQRERGRSSRVVAYRELALVPVPPAMRRRLWPILLDTKSLRDARPALYLKLCKAGEGDLLPDDIEHTIQADVTRTMPSHSLFWSGGAQVGVQSLRSILRAYARYVPTVGYCQGMSSIAAVFLMNAVDEEEAFLMFAQFMNRFQYKKVFAPGFPLMLQWISELKPLVAHYMPQLNLRLERENVSLELYADKWLITALSHNFPHRHLLRVWDLMFLGGSPKIILKACLAVLKQCESRLMKMDFDTMMPFLQRGFAEPDAGVLDAKDPEPFVAAMREFRFMRDIPKSQLEASQAVAAAAAAADAAAAAKAAAATASATSKAPRQETQQAPQQQQQQQRKSALCCLPCFARSPILD